MTDDQEKYIVGTKANLAEELRRHGEIRQIAADFMQSLERIRDQRPLITFETEVVSTEEPHEVGEVMSRKLGPLLGRRVRVMIEVLE